MNSFIDEKAKGLIGYNQLIKQLNIYSHYGKKFFKQMKPFNNLTLLNKEFDLLEEVIVQMHFFDLNKYEKILSKLKDIEKTITICLNGQILDLIDLYEIKIQAILMNELIELLNPILSNSLQLKDCSSIIKILSKGQMITNDFYLYDSYSEQLKEIRKEKREVEQYYFKEKDLNRKDELKEKRSKLVILEEEEELSIRKMLSKQLINEVGYIEENIIKIGHIDVLIAKARMALDYSAVRPHFSSDEILFKDLFHPIIKEQVEKEGNFYIQNTIQMKQGSTVLTGANMSGKSSVLKAVTLSVLLAHLGFYVFSKAADLPLIDSIVYLATELDSNLHGLSSFGQEIIKLNDTIKMMKNSKCLIVMDEFARSTNPSEGQKFVQSFASFAHTFNSFTLLATHYDGVVKRTMNHYQIAGLKDNVEMREIHTISDIHRFMDYTLKKVSLKEEVPKEAYKVSLLLNIDSDFKRYLDENYGSDVNE